MTRHTGIVCLMLAALLIAGLPRDIDVMIVPPNDERRVGTV